MLTDNPREACVHVVPLGSISTERLKGYADNWRDTFTKVIGLRPTGWTYVAFLVPTIASPNAVRHKILASWRDWSSDGYLIDIDQSAAQTVHMA